MTGVTLARRLPETMPAAVIRGRHHIVVTSRPVPLPGPGEVVVEISHCGICGSDLHFILEWGPSRPDSIEGHEWSGTVVAVGPGVDGWRAGEAVVGGQLPRCGVCRHCRANRPSLCAARGRLGIDEYQGAFARYMRCRADTLLAVPDGLSMRHAALTEPLAVALHGINRAGGPTAACRWLVTGGGPIGYLTVAALVAAGVREIVVSEPHARRREVCKELGATAVHPDELPAPPALPMDVTDEPFDVALDCSGNPRAMEAALGLLDRGGTLVLVGSGGERPALDSNRIMLNELVVTGSSTHDGDGLPRALELLASGRLPLDRLVEPVDVGLDGLLEAAFALGDGRLARKVLVSPLDRRDRAQGEIT